MTAPEPSPAALPAGDGERRLHPLSWLFVLLQQLRQFIVPLLVLVFLGRGGGDGGSALWPLVGVGALALASVWQYFTYRYRVAGDSLVVRSGLFERSLRQIPFARIHNVALHQSLLHRLFGVAEVRLESAGGQRPEAQMRVLRLDEALALERLIRHRGAAGAAAEADAPAAAPLLALSTAEVVRLGLISNRGMVVVAGAFALAWQVFPDDAIEDAIKGPMRDVVRGFARQAFGQVEAAGSGLLATGLGVAALVALALVLIRVLSVLLALVQYHGFRLEEHGRRLTVTRGLLTRLRTSASRRRIQAWTLREGLLHRLFARRALEIDTAAGEAQNESRALRELAPIATPETCDALVRHVLPRAVWPPTAWRPLHPRAWLRLLPPGIAFALAAAAALGWQFGAWGLLALLWLPWAAFAARQHARRAGYALDDTLLAVREGWWSRHWRFAELDKLQALELRCSPLDRCCGMATLWLDTAGAGTLAPPLRLRFLPEAEARVLYARLSAAVAARPLRW